MRKTLKVACAFGVLMLLTGCSTTQVGVAAKNAPLDAYEADAGHINTPQYQLGDLIAMDPNSKTAWRVMNVSVSPTETRFGRPGDGEAQSFNAPFELSFSNKVPEATREEVTQAVQAQTDLHVEKTWSRSIKSPATFTIAHPEMIKKMQQVREQSPEARFFLVTGVTNADKVYFTFGEATANQLAINKFRFNFSYSQNDSLEKLAQKSAAFFTATPVAIVADESGRRVVASDASFSEKLPEYSFAETGQAW